MLEIVLYGYGISENREVTRLGPQGPHAIALASTLGRYLYVRKLATTTAWQDGTFKLGYHSVAPLLTSVS